MAAGESTLRTDAGPTVPPGPTPTGKRGGFTTKKQRHREERSRCTPRLLFVFRGEAAFLSPNTARPRSGRGERHDGAGRRRKWFPIRPWYQQGARQASRIGGPATRPGISRRQTMPAANRAAQINRPPSRPSPDAVPGLVPHITCHGRAGVLLPCPIDPAIDGGRQGRNPSP